MCLHLMEPHWFTRQHCLRVIWVDLWHTWDGCCTRAEWSVAEEEHKQKPNVPGSFPRPGWQKGTNLKAFPQVPQTVLRLTYSLPVCLAWNQRFSVIKLLALPYLTYQQPLTNHDYQSITKNAIIILFVFNNLPLTPSSTTLPALHDILSRQFASHHCSLHNAMSHQTTGVLWPNQVPKGSQRFPKVPKGSQRFPKVPNSPKPVPKSRG